MICELWKHTHAPGRSNRRATAAWWAAPTAPGLRASGAALAEVGLALPVLSPAQGLLLHLTADD